MEELLPLLRSDFSPLVWWRKRKGSNREQRYQKSVLFSTDPSVSSYKFTLLFVSLSCCSFRMLRLTAFTSWSSLPSTTFPFCCSSLPKTGSRWKGKLLSCFNRRLMFLNSRLLSKERDFSLSKSSSTKKSYSEYNPDFRWRVLKERRAMAEAVSYSDECKRGEMCWL